jgi:hypothetical protein
VSAWLLHFAMMLKPSTPKCISAFVSSLSVLSIDSQKKNRCNFLELQRYEK